PSQHFQIAQNQFFYTKLRPTFHINLKTSRLLFIWHNLKEDNSIPQRRNPKPSSICKTPLSPPYSSTFLKAFFLRDKLRSDSSFLNLPISKTDPVSDPEHRGVSR
ncbi:hypothetical protein CFOL_v3_34220, partial [Cephalotus follicularis]